MASRTRKLGRSGIEISAVGLRCWPQVIPIPGFKSAKQVEETSQALQFGSLTGKQMSEIETILEPFVSNLDFQD